MLIILIASHKMANPTSHSANNINIKYLAEARIKTDFAIYIIKEVCPYVPKCDGTETMYVLAVPGDKARINNMSRREWAFLHLPQKSTAN